MSLFSTLLTIHIIGGFTALLTAFVAIASKSLDIAHRWHVYSGRIYFWGMFTVFVTAIPMALLKLNLFLFLIAIFSFYAAFSGWRLARNRQGTPQTLDWAAAGITTVSSIAMVGYGIYLLATGENMGITLLVFGGIGTNFGVQDIIRFRAGGLKGKERIISHLQSMMGATIATLTAFVVTNFYIEPAFILWLAPTILMTPVISWWSRRLRLGKRPKGMVSANG